MNRTVSLAVSALIFTLAGLMSACGDDDDGGPTQPPPDPTLGSISVTVSTTGVRLDPDGYTVTVDDTLSQTVPANGVVTFPDLVPGRHTVDLTGEAINCTIVSANSLTVTVTEDVTTQPMLRVECGFLVYVASLWEQKVQVIETVFNTVVATVSVGTNPISVAIPPNGKLVYVGGGNIVGMIEMETHTVVDTIRSVGDDVLAATPDGAFVYTIESNADMVFAIETSSNAVVDHISVGLFPVNLAFTPDAAFAYVVNTDGSLSVIETATNTVVTTVIDVGRLPFGVALSPDGLYAYVTASADDSLLVIETASNAVVATIEVGVQPLGVAVSPDGGFVYVANYEGRTISVIQTVNNAVVATIDVIAKPIKLAITPDGAFVYVTSFNANAVFVIETMSNTIIGTVGVAGGPRAIAITPF